MKAFSTFYDVLLPELPGCTTRMLDLHLLMVARDVCERAGCWSASVTVSAEADRLDYPLSSPEPKSEISRVTRIEWGGQLQWALIRPPRHEQQPLFAPGEPPFALNSAMDTIVLADQPDGEILIAATLRPSLQAIQLPDLLLNRHQETLRVGVLSRLMRMGGKPWSNPALGAQYASEFESHLNHAAMNAQHGNARAPLRTSAFRV